VSRGRARLLAVLPGLEFAVGNQVVVVVVVVVMVIVVGVMKELSCLLY
jgi:hypothetical protein